MINVGDIVLIKNGTRNLPPSWWEHTAIVITVYPPKVEWTEVRIEFPGELTHYEVDVLTINLGKLS